MLWVVAVPLVLAVAMDQMDLAQRILCVEMVVAVALVVRQPTLEAEVVAAAVLVVVVVQR
jgi:hypothetical protein